MQRATEVNPGRQPMSHAIGPAGIVARVTVGMTLVALALFWRTPHWLDFVLGLVVLPGVAIGLLAWRARHHPMPLNATGPAGHVANAIAFAPPIHPARHRWRRHALLWLIDARGRRPPIRRL